MFHLMLCAEHVANGGEPMSPFRIVGLIVCSSILVGGFLFGVISRLMGWYEDDPNGYP